MANPFGGSFSLQLNPSDQDLSVQMLNQILGAGWNHFLTGGVTSAPTTGPAGIIAGMFSLFNMAILGVASTYMVYHAMASSMMTAYDGTPLGRKYHTIWTPLRFPAVFLALVPFPGLNGYSLLQVLMLYFVSLSIGVANSVWGVFVSLAPESGFTSTVPGAGSAGMGLVMQALKMNLASQYLAKNSTDLGLKPASGSLNLLQIWNDTSSNGDNSTGTYTFGFPKISYVGTQTHDIDPDLGTIVIKCSSGVSVPSLQGFQAQQQAFNDSSGSFSAQISKGAQWLLSGGPIKAVIGALTSTSKPAPDARTSPDCQNMVQAVKTAFSQTSSIAKEILAMNPKDNGQPPGIQELQSAAHTAQQAIDKVQQDIANDVASKQSTANTEFANQATQLGWASSAFYYYQMSSLISQMQSILNDAMPSYTAPDSYAIEKQAPAWKDKLPVITKYLEYAGSAGTQTSSAPGGTAQITGHKFLGITNPFVWLLNLELQGMASGNPMSSMISAGNYLMDAGEGMFIVASVIQEYQNKSFIGKAVSNVFDSIRAVGEIATGVGGEIGIIDMVTTFLKVAFATVLSPSMLIFGGVILFTYGVLIGYVIPSMPAIIMIAAVIGWVVLVLEMLVAMPIWALAHAYAEGEGFAPQQASYGYGAFLGMLVRPIALIFGFVISFFVVGVACWFAAQGLGLFLSGMLESVTVGPGAFLATTTVILAVLFMVVRYTMGLITHLAEELPRWIGGVSTNMNDAGAAQQASGEAQQMGRGVGSAGFGKVTSSINEAHAGDGKARAEEAKKSAQPLAQAMKEGFDARDPANAALSRAAEQMAQRYGLSGETSLIDGKTRYGQGAVDYRNELAANDAAQGRPATGPGDSPSGAGNKKGAADEDGTRV